MSELYLLINEKIYKKKNNFFCENKDIQTIVDYLSSKHNLFIISRNSKFVKPFKLTKYCKVFNFNFSKILNFINFFFYLNKNKKKLLMISITPFNFFVFLIFKFFFNCKFYVYLRSNGYKEYKIILGPKFIWIYDFMFKCVTKYSVIISCHKELYNNKCHILYPSELNSNWMNKTKLNFFKNNVISILYVGRFKIEKGTNFIFNIFKKKNMQKYSLTLVGEGDFYNNQLPSNIKIYSYIKNINKLIKIYDDHNVFILPSYTEAHPKVVDEALSRFLPIIIFDDIKHIIESRIGIFSCKRDLSSFLKTVKLVQKNYNHITEQMKHNKFPTKDKFIKDLYNIIIAIIDLLMI